MTAKKRTSRIVQLPSGTEMRLCGVQGELTEKDLAALEELAQAIRNRVTAEHPYLQAVVGRTVASSHVVLELACGHVVAREETTSKYLRQTDCEHCVGKAAQEGETP